MVPQETQLAFEYTVLEMAMMGRYPHLGAFEIEGPADLAIAREALRATGTQHLESRPFNTLSGGEKQRVVIAGALSQLEQPEHKGRNPYSCCSTSRRHRSTSHTSSRFVRFCTG